MNAKQRGFTLMEMIGVVAVIAILASVAAPMIVDSIRNARAAAFVEDVNGLRTAVARFYTDTGRFPTHIPSNTGDGRRLLMTNSANRPVAGWNGPYIEKELVNPFATGRYIGVFPTTNGNQQFDLDGDGNADTSGVLVMRVDDIPETDQRRISDILDQDADRETGAQGWKAAGRVKIDTARPRRLFVYLDRI